MFELLEGSAPMAERIVPLQTGLKKEGGE